MSTAQLKQVATGKKDNPVASFSSFLDKFKPQMALALPKHLTADRMARLAVTAFSSTPKLQECEPKTIVASIMTAATLGLEIGVDGQGFLVPYGRTCQFVPGWKGLVDLVSRSGRATVWTGAVFDGDEFDYALGDSPFIRHRPGEENDPDKITHVYAVGRVNGSEYPVIEVWTIRKVWKHRDKYNKVGAKHYSFRDPEMYARKVPLLQVLKYMPKSIELQNAMAIANAADSGHHAVIDGNFVTVTDPDTGATVDPSTGEIADQRAQQADMMLPSYDDLLSQIRNAKDEEVLALVLDSARDLPQADYVKLEQAYQDRREVLLDA
ncbi:recombinase RecT [Burkholderia vietnamiensis]|uniref:recombinase RecT n=1 Tax=Burkholderia vietnamiensis TaxID=60552 RepID=UPI001B932461|nr:recombinase RecT [Burkholderia vietnamiensis]MBR8228058.1 recombinase RecT [Burkholderia vietnamiensis]